MENPEEIQEIIVGRLFIGSYHCRYEEIYLKSLGIERVCDLSGLECPQFDGVAYSIFSGIKDSVDQLLLPTMMEVHDIVNSSKESRVLVHCNQGISRSAACVVYCVMRMLDITLHTAFILVKKKRRIVFPNLAFFRELIAVEKELRGSTTLEIGPHGQLLWS